MFFALCTSILYPIVMGKADPYWNALRLLLSSVFESGDKCNLHSLRSMYRFTVKCDDMPKIFLSRGKFSFEKFFRLSPGVH